MHGNGQLDGRMARLRVVELAQWWTQASQEERFRLLKKSTEENTPPLHELRTAIILAETEAGEVGEG